MVEGLVEVELGHCGRGNPVDAHDDIPNAEDVTSLSPASGAEFRYPGLHPVVHQTTAHCDPEAGAMSLDQLHEGRAESGTKKIEPVRKKEKSRGDF